MIERLLSDPVSGLTIRRFAAVLGLIALMSIFGTHHHAALFAKLTAFNALLDVMIAVSLRESPAGEHLTRWDEALACLMLFFAARAFA
jgi:hypothetical protein